jgi:4-oxalocrotonate tautomerase
VPLIQVNMLEGRTPEQKRALLSSITEAVHSSIGAPVESIRVWIHEFPSTDFMIAGVLAADRDGARDTTAAAAPGGGTAGG